MLRSELAQAVHLWWEYNEDENYTDIGLGQIGPISTEPILTVGDAFHNLSSALDHVASEMTALVKGNVKRATFPFHESLDNLRDTVSRSPYSDAVKNYIVDVAKPYHGGDNDLWALRKLDNVNKHRFLVGTISLNEIKDFSVQFDGGGVVERFSMTTKGNASAIRMGGKVTKIIDGGETRVSLLINEPDFLPENTEFNAYFAKSQRAVEKIIEDLTLILV